MKKSILLFISLGLIAYGSGQQVMELKSGERMNGKVDKISGDTVTFNFKGNKIKFSTKEISVIYFDEKLINTESKKESQNLNQESKLSGVVTYFFNKNYGDKPDVGASIYILDTLMLADIREKIKDQKVSNFLPEIISDFHFGYSYRTIADQYRALNQPIPEDIIGKIRKYGVDTDEKFKQLESNATSSFILFTMYATKLTADGSGAYSVKLKPGSYIVIIQSSHRKNVNVMESRGVIDYNRITLKPSEERSLSYSFSVN